VTAEEEVADLAPVAAPAAVGTSPEEVRAIRVLAAQHALQRGDLGSLQEDALVAIVAAAPSWDATSGYGAVEAGRGATSALLAPAGPSWDQTSGYGAVEASRATIGSPATSTSAVQTRVLAAQRALQGGDLGSLQEDALLAVVSAGQSWDETSGYGSVEASRATASTLFALVAAPSWDETSGYGSVEASRAAASELLAPSASPSWDDMSGYDSVEASRAAASAMLSGELISGQAQSLALAAATAKSWDETSGYASVEASRAAISDLLAPGKDAVDGVLADC
jgi:hypothetical protein